MIICPERKTVIMCKKCKKIIETKNESYYPFFLQLQFRPFLSYTKTLWTEKRQKNYNKKFKTERLYYKFEICNDCKSKIK